MEAEEWLSLSSRLRLSKGKDKPQSFSFQRSIANPIPSGFKGRGCNILGLLGAESAQILGVCSDPSGEHGGTGPPLGGIWGLCLRLLLLVAICW